MEKAYKVVRLEDLLPIWVLSGAVAGFIIWIGSSENAPIIVPCRLLNLR